MPADLGVFLLKVTLDLEVIVSLGVLLLEVLAESDFGLDEVKLGFGGGKGILEVSSFGD